MQPCVRFFQEEFLCFVAERAWNFRTVGYGHDLKTWADIISALRLVGYDYVVSIEHEDGRP